MSAALEAVATELDAHPHDLRAGVPERLPAHVVRALSRIEPARAARALAAEWVVIAATIAVSTWVASPWLYPLAVVIIGARQQALTVIGHDAAHFRLLPDRRWNDVVGDLFASWPTFIALGAFRKHHGAHHQHLGEAEDGNRFIWKTHGKDGALSTEWTYPKSPAGLAWKLVKRSAFVTGLWWIVRGNLAPLVFPTNRWESVGRLVYTLLIAAALTAADAWVGFLLYWIVPFCTWHMTAQYVRLICEHSGMPGAAPGAYGQTRTTLARAWERWLLVPRNIHFHIEHHWYPAVPFYNLPALHAALMEQPGFRAHAVVTPSVVASLRQTVGA
ncbi:MAG: fatty acid desaturase family protein [Myxococcota bacterium]